MRFSNAARLSLLALSTLVIVPIAHAQDASGNGYYYYYKQDATITQNYGDARIKVGQDANGDLHSPVTVTVSAPAQFGNITVYDNNVLNIVGGQMSQAYAQGPALLNISGGTIDIVNPYTSDSTVNISGGSIRNLQMYAGVSNVTGGTISKASLQTGTLNIYGGTIGGGGFIAVNGQSVVNLYGTDLAIFSSQSGSSFGTNFTDYFLSGTLQNGQSASTITIRDYSGGLEYNDGSQGSPASSFNLIAAAPTAAPEPGSIALGLTAGTPALGIIIRRRRK